MANDAPTNNFDDAFATLASLKENETPPEDFTGAVDDDDTPPAGDDDDTPPAGDDDTPPVDDADDTPPAGDDDTPPAGSDDKTSAAGESDDDLLAKFAKIVKEAGAAKEQPAEKPETAPEDDLPPLYSDEEKSLIDAYQKDWPDVAKAEALVRKGEYREVIGYIFNQVAAELRPIVEAVQALSERTHLSDLHSAVEDYDTVRDKVIEWVDTQPAYLQTAYKHVIQNGTVDDIQDLVERYRRETGAAAPASKPVEKEPELPAEAKKAVASLAPVSSKRSQVPQKNGPDDDDFAGAFQHFAGKLET